MAPDAPGWLTHTSSKARVSSGVDPKVLLKRWNQGWVGGSLTWGHSLVTSTLLCSQGTQDGAGGLLCPQSTPQRRDALASHGLWGQEPMEMAFSEGRWF